MPQLTTKPESNQQTTANQRKPTMATQLAVRNEQIENSQTFDPTKQFVNTAAATQQQVTTEATRSREINNQQNLDSQNLGRDKRKKRSIDSDPEFASIHTIMLAAMRAQQQNEGQQSAPQSKGLEVTGLEVSNFAREVVKEMASRGLPLNLNIMQDALGQALEAAPDRLKTDKAREGFDAALEKEVKKASEVIAKIRADISNKVIAPLFEAAPDPFDPKHQQLLQQRLVLAVELAPELNAKQLKELVESVYNSTLQSRVIELTAEPDFEKRAERLQELQSVRTIPYFMLQQQSPWLFKNQETANALLKLKQESIATDLELTASRLSKGQDGAAFDRTWTQLAAEAELTFGDVFTKEFRSNLDSRRLQVWTGAERRIQLENEVELTLRQVLTKSDLLDAGYQSRKEALSARFQSLGQAEDFNRIVQRLEIAFIERSVAAAAKDPFNPANAFGLTILQGTKEQFAAAFPQLVGTGLEDTLNKERRRAGVNIAFQGVNLAGLSSLTADNLSPIIAAQEAQAHLLLPALRSDSMFKYNLQSEFDNRLSNEREISRQSLALIKAEAKDPVAAAKEINPALADAIVERFRAISRERDEVSKTAASFEVASREMTVTEREAKLKTLKITLEKNYPNLARDRDLFEGTIISAISAQRKKEEVELSTDRAGTPSIASRVTSFYDAAWGGGTDEAKLDRALIGLTPYGVELFRTKLRERFATTPEAIIAGEYNNDGTDEIYKKIAMARLNADNVTADELLVVGAWRLGKEEVERFIAESSPEHRAQVANRIKQNYHMTMLGQSMADAAAGDKLAYQRYMLAFKEDSVSRQAYALRQAIDSRDAMSITTQMRSLSAADVSAEKLRQAIISGDRERIIASVADIRPEHLGMMDQAFRGALGQRLALALPNDSALPVLAQRLGVKVDSTPNQLDNKDFTINYMVPSVETKFSDTFSRDWRASAQDTEDAKLRMAAAGDEVALALANLKEAVGSFELSVLGQSGLRDTEVSQLIGTLVTVSERGQMAGFKSAFHGEHGESLDDFITNRLYINSGNSREILVGGQAEILHSLALKVVSGEKLTVSDKLGIGLVLGGYTKADIPAITTSIPPSELVAATKDLAKVMKENEYRLPTVDIEGLSGKLNSAQTADEQRQAAADLLFALYEFRYESSLGDREKFAAKHAFRGQADTREQIRRLAEIAEYNRGRVIDDNSFNGNPFELFGAPSVAINSLASSDDRLLADANFAATTAANLQKRFEMSEAESKAFDVFSRLGTKESLTPEEEREARRADELMKSYTARIGSMTPEELAVLRTAQSQLAAGSGSYFAMRETASEIVAGVGEAAAVIAVTMASGGSMTYIVLQSSGWSFVIRSTVNSSVLGGDYTDDMRFGDMKHAAIMGASQVGAAATMTFFKGLAAKGLAAAGNKIPALGQALQTAKKAEEVVASIGTKVAQVEANAAAAAGKQAANVAKTINAGGGGAMNNFVGQTLKSGLEWGATGGTAGAISSVLHNSTSAEFWRQNGLTGGLVKLATNAGHDAVVSAIISGQLGLAVPATILVSRSIAGIRGRINAKIEEAKAEIWDTLLHGEMPSTRPGAQSATSVKPLGKASDSAQADSKLLQEMLEDPRYRPTEARSATSAKPVTNVPNSDQDYSKLLQEMLEDTLYNPTLTPSTPTMAPGMKPSLSDATSLAAKPVTNASDIDQAFAKMLQNMPDEPLPQRYRPHEVQSTTSAKSVTNAQNSDQANSTLLEEMLEGTLPRTTKTVQSSPVKDTPKPPSDGGAPSGKSSEPVSPSTPKDSRRIHGETTESTAVKPENDGGSVALAEPPTAQMANTISPKTTGQGHKNAPTSSDNASTPLHTVKRLRHGDDGKLFYELERLPSPEPLNPEQGYSKLLQEMLEDPRYRPTEARSATSAKPVTNVPNSDQDYSKLLQEMLEDKLYNPPLTPSTPTMAPGMKPSLSDATSLAVGSETALFGKITPTESTAQNTSMSPAQKPEPQNAQRPASATSTRDNKNKKDENKNGLAVGIADEMPPVTPGISRLDRSPDFDPTQIGRIVIETSNTDVLQMTTLEKIELENKQREKKTKVISQYTRRRRRADGTEYDGDFDVAFTDDEVDEKGNPLKNGSRVVTGDRIVTVQIGTTVTRSED